MPTILPNGLCIFNTTPHDLHFQYREEMITAPSDEVLNALPITQIVKHNGVYDLVTVEFHPLKEGEELIAEIRNKHPTALIVGSIIAAQAYPECIVASVPHKGGRYNKQFRLLVRSDRFTTFLKKESSNNG